MLELLCGGFEAIDKVRYHNRSRTRLCRQIEEKIGRNLYVDTFALGAVKHGKGLRFDPSLATAAHGEIDLECECLGVDIEYLAVYERASRHAAQ